MQIEIERVTLEKERQRIAEERLKALRQQRKKLEESIIKMSNEMSKDVDLVTEDRKQRRINMENEYLNQIDLEEAAVDDRKGKASRRRNGEDKGRTRTVE